jgi:hypothetical protein
MPVDVKTIQNGTLVGWDRKYKNNTGISRQHSDGFDMTLRNTKHPYFSGGVGI